MEKVLCLSPLYKKEEFSLIVIVNSCSKSVWLWMEILNTITDPTTANGGTSISFKVISIHYWISPILTENGAVLTLSGGIESLVATGIETTFSNLIIEFSIFLYLIHSNSIFPSDKLSPLQF